MRQLKTFMRNRKKEMLGCGPCECRTLQCWRYANENCGCGEDVVQESIAFDGIYDGVTIPVGQSYNIGFTAIPEDLEYTITLSNQSLEIENQVDEGTHHTMDLRAMHAGHDGLIPCDVTISSANASVTTTIYAVQPVETIGQPSDDNIQIAEGTQGSFTFDYTPTNANPALDNYVGVESGDRNVAVPGGFNLENTGNGTAEVLVTGVTPGTTTITYTLYSDPTQTYTVNVEIISLP